MKFIIKIILIAGITYTAQLILPFWIIAVIAFVVNLGIRTNGWTSFFSGFIAIFLLWFIVASAIESHQGEVLSGRISALFSVSPLILKIITASIGALVAGFAGLTSRMLFERNTKRATGKYYS